MATEYGKRLIRAMEYAGINQKELVKRTGLKQSTVSSAINRSKGSSDTPAYASACGVAALWLSIGDGEMHLHPRQTAIETKTYQPSALVSTTSETTESPISAYAKAIGLMFDSLPDDAHIRARVMGEITSAILAAKRPPENLPPTAPAHARSPKRQFS